MSALSVQAFRQPPPAAAALRFGSPGDGEDVVRWLLRRNCSTTPARLVALYLSLCAGSLGIGVAFWWHGATLVLPFTGVELLAVGVALLVYARHATDRERLVLTPGRLSVECTLGRRSDEVAFAPAWVRVEPVHGERSLIELSGEGKRISIGRFVRPEHRQALADELRAALRRHRPARSAGDHGAPARD